MSYTARTTLVNSVMLSLHTYWASIFIIPKCVIKQVMAICRNFIWDGRPVYTRIPPISWDIICRPKKKGGLGIHDSHIWKHVAHIACNQESLWLQWVQHVYIKGRNWKRYKCPPSAAWNWKQICKVKELLKDGFTRDRWNLNPDGYTIKSGYQWLKNDEIPDVDWYSWVWNRLNIPKHRFICWMILWKRIRVRAKLKAYGMIQDDTCTVCGSHTETIEHLFFQCDYAQICCKIMQDRLRMNITPSNLEGCNRQISCIPGRFKRRVVQSCYAGLMYSIWHQRNKALWDGVVQQPDKMIKGLLSEVYQRICYVMPKKTSVNDRRWPGLWKD